MKFIIKGKASGSVYKEWHEANLAQIKTLSLMQYLIDHQIPIASTCLGKGVCEKCLINGNILSCQISVADFIQKFSGSDKKAIIITINYL